MIRYLSRNILTVAFFIFVTALPVRYAVAEEKQTYVLASSRPSDSPVNQWWTLIYTEVFDRLGLKLNVRSYPLARASNEADKGHVDGETIRVYAYADAHPNLIRVEEPTVQLRLVAYTGKSAVPGIDGWKNLKGTHYNVGYARGAHIVETNLSKILEPEQISPVIEAVQGLRKLVSGRADIYIDDENVVLPLLALPEFKERIRVVGTMDETPLHLYMHKRHAAMVTKLAEAIKALKKDGLVEKFWNTAFGIQNE